MNEFNIEDLDAVIARSREGSLAQLLALQLKCQISKAEQMAADNEKAMDSLRQADAAVKLAHEKYSAIAAENVALKQAESNLVRNIINDLGDTEFQYAKVHTPATDRILAAAEARGVEKFAAEQRGVAERLKKRGGDVVMSSIKFCLESAEEAEVFAQQLREGAK
ncbi:hypothetical protein ACQJ21_02195 [Klebsiella michiganensis]|uniref:hypothetical protein n=1 Tax=Klebsiella michiganensis TaxID=1134687 RepID=UPI003D0616B1